MSTKLLKLTSDLKTARDQAPSATSRTALASIYRQKDEHAASRIEDLEAALRDRDLTIVKLKRKIALRDQELAQSSGRRSSYKPHLSSRAPPLSIAQPQPNAQPRSQSQHPHDRPQPQPHVEPHRDQFDDVDGHMNATHLIHRHETQTRELHSQLHLAKQQADFAQAKYDDTLRQLNEAETRNATLTQQLSTQHLQLQQQNEQIKHLRAQLKQRAAAPPPPSTAALNVTDDIEVIRLQRQLRDRNVAATAFERRLRATERELDDMRVQHETTLESLERVHDEARRERERAAKLERTARASERDRSRVTQLEERVRDADEEKRLLLQENERLAQAALLDPAHAVDSAMASERQHESLQAQVARLETALKSELNERQRTLEQLDSARRTVARTTRELSDARDRERTLQRQLDRHITHESTHDDHDHEQPNSAIRTSAPDAPVRSVLHHLDFLEPTTAFHTQRADSSTVTLLRAQLAETAQELEQSQRLLKLQQSIATRCKEEARLASERTATATAECDRRLAEMARLLDMRGTRARRLEQQLRSVAYGPRSVSRTAPEQVHTETPPIPGGANVVDVRLSCVRFDVSPASDVRSLFVVFDFFAFETQTSPVVAFDTRDSLQVPINFASEFVIDPVDDFFLRYLQHARMRIEVHAAVGAAHECIAVALVSLAELLVRPAAVRLDYTAVLTHPSDAAQMLGQLDYSLRLRLPLGQALVLFNERRTHDDSSVNPDSNVNELELALSDASTTDTLSIAINNVDLLGQSTHAQRVYAIYRVLGHDDHATHTVTAVARVSAVLHDRKSFSLVRTRACDTWLRSGALQVYLFNDTDTDTNTDTAVDKDHTNRDDQLQASNLLIGVATIPLSPLYSRGDVRGQFDVLTDNDKLVALLDVSLHWQHIQAQQQQPVAKAAPVPPSTNSKPLTVTQPSNSAGARSPSLPPSQSTTSSSADNSDLDLDLDLTVTLPPPKETQSITRDLSVTLSIDSLSVAPYASFLSDPQVKRLFVDFQLLGVAPDLLETAALPVARDSLILPFAFEHTIACEPATAPRQWTALCDMAREREQGSGTVTFSVVSEPDDEGDGECREIGSAQVDLCAHQGRLNAVPLPVLDTSGQSIGRLVVSIDAERALACAQRESEAVEEH